MDINFNCPKCGQHIAVDQAGAGMALPCPSCNQTLTVPPLAAPKPSASRTKIWLFSALFVLVAALASLAVFWPSTKIPANPPSRVAAPLQSVPEHKDSTPASTAATSASAAKPAEPPLNHEIDSITFCKAIVEGKVEDYKGFLVRGVGAAPQVSTEVGKGGKATVLVCGRRPDGTIYAITKLPNGDFNFNAYTDRLFYVQLLWLESKVPKGYQSGNFSFISGMQELAEHFEARFEGEYSEVTVQQSGQEARKEKVPVLVWEAAATTSPLSPAVAQAPTESGPPSTTTLATQLEPEALTVSGVASSLVIRYRVGAAPELKPGEYAELVVLLTQSQGPALDRGAVTAHDVRDSITADVKIGFFSPQRPTNSGIIWFNEIGTTKPGQRNAYRFLVPDTDRQLIHAGAVLELRPGLFEPSPGFPGSPPSGHVDWKWIAHEGKVSAALVACKKKQDFDAFQRFLSDVATTRLSTSSAPPAPPTLAAAAPTQLGGRNDLQPGQLLKLLSLFGNITELNIPITDKNGTVNDALLAAYLDPNSQLSRLYKEKLGITMPPTDTLLLSNTAVRLPEVVAAIDTHPIRPDNIDAFPDRRVSFEKVTSFLGARVQKEIAQELPVGTPQLNRPANGTWYRYGRWRFGGKDDITVIRISFPPSSVPAPPSPEAASTPRATSPTPHKSPRPSVAATKQPRPTGNTPLPPFTLDLVGSNEVRVRNPNDFSVAAGVRSGDMGKNLAIPANGVESVYVPDGSYDIYFVYSDKPDALFQGDSFTLSGNGVEIRIVKVVNGNYGIRQVK